MNKWKSICLTVGMVGANVIFGTVQGQVLMFDFGGLVPTGATSNSPYHTANPGFSGSSWNVITNTTDLNNLSLSYADGSTASGITLSIGWSSQAYTVRMASNIDTTVRQVTGSTVVSGVFAGNSVGKDFFIVGSGNAENNALALRIGGLAAGSYDLYLTGINTSAVLGATPMSFFASSSLTDSTFAYNNVTWDDSAMVTNDQTATWQEGKNYAVLHLTVSAGEDVTLLASGANVNSQWRGILNSLEIVAVPEPSVGILFGTGSLVIVASVWRGRLGSRNV